MSLACTVYRNLIFMDNCIDSKEYIVLSARVHPSESNSNWIMKGK